MALRMSYGLYATAMLRVARGGRRGAAERIGSHDELFRWHCILLYGRQWRAGAIVPCSRKRRPATNKLANRCIRPAAYRHAARWHVQNAHQHTQIQPIESALWPMLPFAALTVPLARVWCARYILLQRQRRTGPPAIVSARNRRHVGKGRQWRRR